MQCPRCGSNWLPQYGLPEASRPIAVATANTTLSREPSVPTSRSQSRPGTQRCTPKAAACPPAAGFWASRKEPSIPGLKKVRQARELLKLLWEQRQKQPPGQPRLRVISFDETWTYQRARRRGKRQEVWFWTAIAEEADGQRWVDFGPETVPKPLFCGGTGGYWRGKNTGQTLTGYITSCQQTVTKWAKGAR